MSNWYVSPNALAAGGDGSLGNPWNINTLFAAEATLAHTILPGDIVFLRGGRYPNPGAYLWWPTILGGAATATTARNPITIRSYPGDPRPQLDCLNFDDAFFMDNPARSSNNLGHNVHDTDWYDIEWYSSNIVRSTSLTGNNGMPNNLAIEGSNNRLIHCYVHDLGDFATFGPAANNVIYGCISMDHGWSAPDRGHGHLLYCENDNSTGSVKTIQNNFFVCAYDAGVQEFGTAALTRAISFLNNTVANAGGAPAVNNANLQWMIGQNNPTDIITDGNVFFVSPSIPQGASGVQMGWPWDINNGVGQYTNNLSVGANFTVRCWQGVTVKGNKTFPIAGNTVSFYLNPGAAPPQSFKNWTVDDNVYGATTFATGTQTFDSNFNPTYQVTTIQSPAAWQAAISGDQNSTFNTAPSLAVYVDPSAFIPGRVHITAWNPSALATIPVDLSKAGLADGTAFDLMDAQNFGGASVMTGTYSVANPIIQVPATGLTRKPMIGVGAQPAHTAPYLLTFVLLSGQAIDGTWNTVPGNPLPPISPLPPPPTPPSVPITGVNMTGNFTVSPTSLPAGGGNIILIWSNLTLSDGTTPTGLNLIANPPVAAFPAAGTAEPATHTTPAFAVTQTTVFSLVSANGDSMSITIPVGGSVTPPPPTGPVQTITATGLPVGLTLSTTGVLSGTPSVAGAYTMAVNMTDTAGNSGSITYTGSIAPAATGTKTTGSPATLPAMQVGVPISPVTITFTTNS